MSAYLGIGLFLGAIVGIWFDIVVVIIFLKMLKNPKSRASRIWGDRSKAMLVSPVMFFHSLWMFAGMLLALGLYVLTTRGSPALVEWYQSALVVICAVLGITIMRKTKPYHWLLFSLVIVFFLCFWFLLPWLATPR